MLVIPADVLDRHRKINSGFIHISVANNSVRLVSCDSKIMAVELIDHAPGEWEATIKVPDTVFDNIEINPVPAANMMFSAYGNLWTISPPEYAMWREIPKRAEKVVERFGFMFWNTAGMKQLFEASPSGCLTFPTVIDTRQPIVLNDENDEKWVGFFMGLNAQYSRDIKPATVKGFVL